MRRGSLNGYNGSINRVIKIKGKRMEYFISGSPETTFEEATQDNWPFEEYDSKSKFRIVTKKGVDVTKNALSSHAGTVLIEFIS